jgi:uncharacterized membrane protein YraQ (UPF0718 family)
LNIVNETCGCSTGTCPIKAEKRAGLPKYLALLLPALILWGLVYHFLAPLASWLTVSVLVGIPMYSNAAGIIPVVQALLGKGAALGTVLAFMMSVIALSLPEFIILRKVLKPRLIAVFIGVVGIGIMAVGYLFNALSLQ